MASRTIITIWEGVETSLEVEVAQLRQWAVTAPFVDRDEEIRLAINPQELQAVLHPDPASRLVRLRVTDFLSATESYQHTLQEIANNLSHYSTAELLALPTELHEDLTRAILESRPWFVPHYRVQSEGKPIALGGQGRILLTHYLESFQEGVPFLILGRTPSVKDVLDYSTYVVDPQGNIIRQHQQQYNRQYLVNGEVMQNYYGWLSTDGHHILVRDGSGSRIYEVSSNRMIASYPDYVEVSPNFRFVMTQGQWYERETNIRITPQFTIVTPDGLWSPDESVCQLFDKVWKFDGTTFIHLDHMYVIYSHYPTNTVWVTKFLEEGWAIFDGVEEYPLTLTDGDTDDISLLRGADNSLAFSWSHDQGYSTVVGKISTDLSSAERRALTLSTMLTIAS